MPKINIFFYLFGPCKKWPRWLQMGPGGFFPTNPDLADVLGRTDFDFENLYFLDFVGFQIPRFPGPQISRSSEIWPGPGLGRAGPGLGRVGPRVGGIVRKGPSGESDGHLGWALGWPL